MRKNTKGFTLIELLVVIAIIAVLAGILFPVFAQVKDKGRQATCIAHLRQVAAAFAMYNLDNADRMPPLYYTGPAKLTQPDNYGFFRWPWLIYPYTKTFDVFFCPSDVKAPQYRNTADPMFGYQFGLTPSWGYNATYLSPGADPILPDHAPFKPIKSPAVASPSETVLLAESTWLSPPQPGMPPDTADVGFYRVYPPSQWAGAPPVNGLSYGHVWPRHKGKVSVAFADGHVRAMQVTQLNDERIWKAIK